MRLAIWQFALVLLILCSSDSMGVQSQSQQEIGELAATAQQAQQNREYSKAIELYKRLIHLSPGTAELYSNLGVSCHMAGQLEDARVAFERALSLKGTLTVPKLFLGIEYCQASQPNKAIPYLLKAVTENPKDLIAGKWLAQSYFDVQDYLSAVRQLRGAIKSSEQDAELLYLLGESYLKLSELRTRELGRAFPDSHLVLLIHGQSSEAKGDLDTALYYCRLSLQKKPDQLETHLQISNLLLAKAEFGQAIAQCQQALGLNPDDPRPNRLIVKLLIQQGQQESALTYARKLDALVRVGALSGPKPISPPAVLPVVCANQTKCAELALRLEKEREPLRALVAWKTAKGLGVLTPAMRLGLARVQFSVRLLQQAVETLKPIADLKMLPDEGAIILGRAFLEFGKPESAEPALLGIKRTSLFYPEALYELARCYGEMARKAFESLREKAPESYWADTVMARSLAARGETDQAIAEYEKALKKQPEARLIHLALGNLYWKKFDDQNAILHFEKELSRTPNNPVVNYALGHVYLERREIGRALPLLLKAVLLDPELSDARKDLGKLYLLEQKPAEAAAELETYLSQSPRDKTAYYQLFQAYKALGQQAKADGALRLFKLIDQEERQKPLQRAERHRRSDVAGSPEP